MAVHKRQPIFLRIKTTDNAIVCINPHQLSSFQLLEKGQIKQKDGTMVETPVVRFYFPVGTVLSYAVGVEITQSEFDYISYTLSEYLYLNEIEFRSREEAKAHKRMEDFQKMMEEEEQELKHLEAKQQKIQA